MREQALADEEERIERYRKENARRRHNFVPFIFQLLQVVSLPCAKRKKRRGEGIERRAGGIGRR